MKNVSEWYQNVTYHSCSLAFLSIPFVHHFLFFNLYKFKTLVEQEYLLAIKYNEWLIHFYLLIKLCSLLGSVVQIKVKFLDCCQGFSYFLWNRNWVSTRQKPYDIRNRFMFSSAIVHHTQQFNLLFHNWLCLEFSHLSLFLLLPPPLLHFPLHFLLMSDQTLQLKWFWSRALLQLWLWWNLHL